jgi:hypothetical protein
MEAANQLDSEILFKVTDMMTQGSLGHEQLLCGALEAEVSPDRFEGPQLDDRGGSQIHGPLTSLYLK